METKHVHAPLTLKADDDTGAVTSVFSTFDVVDHDGDVVLKTAIPHGAQVPMAWSHDWQTLVGKGRVSVEADRALFDGHFFLDTTAGADAYKTVKALGELTEWSWGFRIKEAEYGELEGQRVRFIKRADIYEVSPVLRGAGIGTRTLAIKSQQTFGDHAEQVLADLKTFLARTEGLLAELSAKGQQPSDAKRQQVLALLGTFSSLAAVQQDLERAAKAFDPQPADSPAVPALYAAYLRTLATLNGVA